MSGGFRGASSSHCSCSVEYGCTRFVLCLLVGTCAYFLAIGLTCADGMRQVGHRRMAEWKVPDAVDTSWDVSALELQITRWKAKGLLATDDQALEVSAYLTKLDARLKEKQAPPPQGMLPSFSPFSRSNALVCLPRPRRLAGSDVDLVLYAVQVRRRRVQELVRVSELCFVAFEGVSWLCLRWWGASVASLPARPLVRSSACLACVVALAVSHNGRCGVCGLACGCVRLGQVRLWAMRSSRKKFALL